MKIDLTKSLVAFASSLFVLGTSQAQQDAEESLYDSSNSVLSWIVRPSLTVSSAYSINASNSIM